MTNKALYASRIGFTLVASMMVTLSFAFVFLVTVI